MKIFIEKSPYIPLYQRGRILPLFRKEGQGEIFSYHHE